MKILSIFVLIGGGVFYLMPPSIHSRVFDGHEMTIDYHIVVNCVEGDEPVIKDIIKNTFEEIDHIYNNWNPQSEISRINRLQAYEIISLSDELNHFFQVTDKLVTMSEGRFDPTIEPLQKIWKNHLQMGTVPSLEKIEEVLPAVGWKHLHFGQGKIFKDHDKTGLDFGGIAKGYCVDLLVERIVKAGFKDVLVDWGGELRAHGRHSAKRPWRVFVGCLDDVDPNHAIAELSLENQSVATSGDYLQNWSVKDEGVETVYFHIIDPRTAKPLKSTRSSIASATVLAPTCVMADALAKAAIMHDTISEAREWAEEISYHYPEIKIWLFAREESDSQEAQFL